VVNVFVIFFDSKYFNEDSRFTEDSSASIII